MSQMTIKSLADKISKKTVTLNGIEIEVRALNGRETDRMYRLFPEPQAPLIKDPNAGSLAPKVPDTNDPKYVELHREWFVRIQTIMVLIASGIARQDGTRWDATLPDDALRAWCSGACDELRDACSFAEIFAVHAEVRNLGNTRDAARQQLIVEIPEDFEVEQADQIKLPARYGHTPAMAALEVCEKFAIDPFRALDQPYDHPGMWTLLREYLRIRAEERAASFALKD